MDIEELLTKQITSVVEERIARVHAAFGELKGALLATRLTSSDFQEATALGIDTSNAQLAMDYWMRKYLGSEVFEFIKGYEAAHQRDLSAKTTPRL